MSYKKIGKVGIALLLVAALLYFADISAIILNLQKTNVPLYLAGVSLFLLTYIPASLRWKNLSNSIDYDLDFLTAFKIISISYSFNKVFPGNSGDVLRSKIFQRYRDIDNHGNILGIVALERFLDIISLGIVIGFSVIFVASDYFSQVYWLLLPFGVLAALFAIMLFLNEKWIQKFVSLTPVAEGFFSDIITGYRSCSQKSLGLNTVYSLSIWLLEAFAFYLFIQALALNLGFWDGALITSLMSLVSGLPITPGGLGAVDAAGTGLLLVAGLEYSAALSLIVLQRSIGLIIMALIGVIVYVFEELTESRT